MAETYQLVCDQCRVQLWIGQDHAYNRDRFRLYGGNYATPRDKNDGPFSPTAAFLLAHEEHPLRFLSSNAMDEPETDYAELDGDRQDLPIKSE